LKTVIKYLGGLILAALLLWWTLKGIDGRQLAQSIRAASVPGLILAGLLNVSHNLFRVLRWQALLKPVRARIPFLPMFSAVILGYMTTWILPGRLGELVRPALLTAREKVPLGPCIGSVLADRLMDMVAILLWFAIGSFSVTFTGEAGARTDALQWVGLVLIFMVASLLTILGWIAANRSRAEAFLSRRGRWGRRIGRTLVSFSRGTEGFRSFHLFVRILFHSMMCWLVISLSTWIGLRAAGVEIPLPGVFMLQPLLALGFAVPVPGGVGAFHTAAKEGLILFFKTAETLATGAGILLHLVSVIPILVLGTLLFWIQNYTMADIRAGIAEVKSLGADPEEVSR